MGPKNKIVSDVDSQRVWNNESDRADDQFSDFGFPCMEVGVQNHLRCK